jgi:hypothetical protein
MGLLVAVCIVSANKALGQLGVAVGCASAAVLVFTLRKVIDEESSLYSFPVRFWPPLLGGLSILSYFSR